MSPIQDRNKSFKNRRKSGKFNSNSNNSAKVHGGNKKTSRGLVRIIAGTHRGRRLPVIVSEGLRPTSDRVKETLFNWLMSSIPGAKCLDMYAGSGGLGIEALSRGAEHVTFFESDTKAAEQVTSNIATLREHDSATVICSNILQYQFSQASFDVVFIDPPFGKDMVTKSIELLLTANILSKNCYVYIETGHDDDYTLPANFSAIKELKTSQAYARLFQFNA